MSSHATPPTSATASRPNVLVRLVNRAARIGVAPEDTPDVRIRKGTLALASLSITALATAFVVMYLALGRPFSAAIPFAYQVASVTSLVWFARTRRYDTFRVTQVVLMLLLPVLLQWSLGGFENGSAVMLWAFVAPVGALVFGGPRAAIAAFAAFVGLTVLSGVIDPWLKTLSFWNNDQPLCAVSFYAVHPMSYYGQGEVSADFPGLARRQRQADLPAVKQIYASGCSGNVTAGKYNNGERANRAALASRLHAAMAAAWQATVRHPVASYKYRVTPLRLEPRDGPGFTVADLEQKLGAEQNHFQQCLAAMGLSWRRRADAGHAIDLPTLDFQVAQLLVLPGESYVEYQLAAQRLKPDSFVCVAGYGEGATGYIPTEQHIAEHDSNLGDWWWVAPGSEPRLLAAIRAALQAE